MTTNTLKLIRSIVILILAMQHEGSSAKKMTPTNPRQRRSSSTYNASIHRDKLGQVVRFFVLNDKKMQDYGQPCDPLLHSIWTDPSNGKDILSTDSNSFSADTSWHNKICNIFAYLECSNQTNTCKCASQSKFDMKLIFDEKDGAQFDKEKPNKKKRRCRAVVGEICNYIRILPVPKPAFPGVDFDLNDFFECITNSTCKDVGKEADGFFYERCVTNSRAKRIVAANWKLTLMELLIFNLVSFLPY